MGGSSAPTSALNRFGPEWRGGIVTTLTSSGRRIGSYTSQRSKRHGALNAGCGRSQYRRRRGSGDCNGSRGRSAYARSAVLGRESTISAMWNIGCGRRMTQTNPGAVIRLCDKPPFKRPVQSETCPRPTRTTRLLRSDMQRQAYGSCSTVNGASVARPHDLHYTHTVPSTLRHSEWAAEISARQWD